MDKDNMKGKMNQAKGSAREAMGKMTGNEKQEAAGKIDKAKGKAQEKVGQAKEEVNKRT